LPSSFSSECIQYCTTQQINKIRNLLNLYFKLTQVFVDYNIDCQPILTNNGSEGHLVDMEMISYGNNISISDGISFELKFLISLKLFLILLQIRFYR
jgi:hypothetical protein